MCVYKRSQHSTAQHTKIALDRGRVYVCLYVYAYPRACVNIAYRYRKFGASVREDPNFAGAGGTNIPGCPASPSPGPGKRRSSNGTSPVPPAISAAVAATGFGRSRRTSHTSPSPQPPHAPGALPPVKSRRSSGSPAPPGDHGKKGGKQGPSKVRIQCIADCFGTWARSLCQPDGPVKCALCVQPGVRCTCLRVYVLVLHRMHPKQQARLMQGLRQQPPTAKARTI